MSMRIPPAASLGFAAVLAAFAVSYAGHAVPGLTVAGGFALAIATTVAYGRSFALGTAFVLAELVGGSLGRLFVLPGGVTVRMALFLVALAATAIRLARSPEDRRYVVRHAVRWPYALVAAAIVWGVMRGLTATRFETVALDANAYAYFLLLPTFLLALRGRDDRDRALAVVLGASSAVSVLTLSLLVAYTQGVPDTVLGGLYRWVRDDGLGEITRAPGGFVRVFLQAQLWNFVVFLWSVPLLMRRPRDPWLWIASVLSAAVVLVSFSRTFWAAAGAAAFTGLLAVLFRPEMRPAARQYVLTFLAVTLLGVALPFVLTRTVTSAALTRAGSLAGEPAASSRMNLLRTMLPAIREKPLLGWGFGKELTYVTRDPRLLAYFPDGNYTTAAFEWGWLDFWLKMGLLGPVAFAFLVWTLVRAAVARSRVSRPDPWLPHAFDLAVLGAAIAHLFSPWLNHPLGIGVLLLAAGAFAAEE